MGFDCLHSAPMTPSTPEITPEILATIDLLEVLEQWLEQPPTPAVEAILQQAWLQISQTFPEDFQAATQEDAGAEGLRRYVRIKQFFADPVAHPIGPAELEAYYRSRTDPIDPDTTDYFFL
jgi:hypothetical protein